MDNPSKQELKNWRDDPATKYVLERLKMLRQDELEATVHATHSDIIHSHIDKVIGMDKAIDLFDNIHQEGEEE